MHRAIAWHVGVYFGVFLAGGLLAWAQGVTTQDCMGCHEQLEVTRDDGRVRSLTIDLKTFRESSHGALECSDCHADIREIPHPDRLAKADCSQCHEDVAKVYATSVHAQSLEPGGPGEGATCASCHGAHDILPSSNPQSRVSHRNLAGTCIQCHEDQALIEQHRLPSQETIQSYVFSVHGQSNVDNPESKAATCNDCHGWHDIQKDSTAGSKVSRQNVAKTCGRCHTPVLEEFYESVHGRLGRQGNPDVPVCTDCHGEHSILSPQNRQSTVSRFRITETCGTCHENPEIVQKYQIPIASPSTYYRASVHGKALLSGENESAAACQDCHGYHLILEGQNPQSMVNRSNITTTCGSCHQHQDIQKEFERSVHGQAVRRGVRESPVCTDCHGEHTILSHLDPNSPVYPVRLAKEVCGRCHDSLVLNRKYGLPAAQVSTYLESYHGLASRLGDTTVANCASCHGVHDILPSSDPASTIHPDNLLKTCGKCHPGASPQFVAGLVHVSARDTENLILFWVRRIYIILIVVTIGGMLVHNLLIIYRQIRDKYRRQKAMPYVVRFPTVAIIQHLLLTITFILLVITGFSLSFPDSLYSQMITTYLGLGEKERSIVHRVAGVVLGLTLFWHIGTILLTRRGRQELRALWFGWRDVRDVVQNVAYHLGIAKTKPRFDRYDYSEKMEYWAFLWGSVVMLLTGLLMWFPAKAAVLLGLSKFWVDVATVIHYYEAWLATLAIVVWHFFFVIFHPEEYPMAMSWLTGKLPVREMEERHPEELERLRAEGAIRNPKTEE